MLVMELEMLKLLIHTFLDYVPVSDTCNKLIKSKSNSENPLDHEIVIFGFCNTRNQSMLL